MAYADRYHQRGGCLRHGGTAGDDGGRGRFSRSLTKRRITTIRPRVPFKNLTGPVPSCAITDGHAAVLVVDVHRFTVSPDHGFGRLASERGIIGELGEYYEQLEQAVPNVIRLLETCRPRGLPVIFTRLVADDGRDVTPQARVTGFWAAAGSSEAEFVPELRPHPEDVVINKTATSGFTSGTLDALLRERGIEHLIICGVLTNSAVEHTARDAADRGYGVIVVTDACAAESWAIGAFVMTTLVGGLVRTRSTQAVLEMLNGTRT